MDEFDELMEKYEKKGIIKFMHKSKGQMLGGHNYETEE